MFRCHNSDGIWSVSADVSEQSEHSDDSESSKPSVSVLTSESPPLVPSSLDEPESGDSAGCSLSRSSVLYRSVSSSSMRLSFCDTIKEICNYTNRISYMVSARCVRSSPRHN